MILLLSQNLINQHSLLYAKVNSCFQSSYTLGKPQIYNIHKIRTYAQSMGVIFAKKQLDYLQRRLKIKFNRILKLTSSKKRVHTQEKLAKIKEVNVEIGDLLFQIEVVSENLLDRVSGKYAADLINYIKTKRKNDLERKERDFNIDEEGDDFPL